VVISDRSTVDVVVVVDNGVWRRFKVSVGRVIYPSLRWCYISLDSVASDAEPCHSFGIDEEV
jgi:hypothetical protein